MMAPPPKRRTSPSEQTDEAASLIESEQVDIEREAPLGEHESVEQDAPRDSTESPTFE